MNKARKYREHSIYNNFRSCLWNTVFHQDFIERCSLFNIHCVRHCSKHFTNINSPQLIHNILERQVLLFLFWERMRHRKWKWVKVKSLSRVWFLATPWTTAHQALRPWDFPGKSTGVGCHCLLRKDRLLSKYFPQYFPQMIKHANFL